MFSLRSKPNRSAVVRLQRINPHGIDWRLRPNSSFEGVRKPFESRSGSRNMSVSDFGKPIAFHQPESYVRWRQIGKEAGLYWLREDACMKDVDKAGHAYPRKCRLGRTIESWRINECKVCWYIRSTYSIPLRTGSGSEWTYTVAFWSRITAQKFGYLRIWPTISSSN